ncbi:MAG: ABC transporter ATP-binding protein [Rubrivivax sp.]
MSAAAFTSPAPVAATAARDPIEALCWPHPRLGEAIDALGRTGGLAPRAAELPVPPSAAAGDEALEARWMHWAAGRLGLELEPSTTTVPEVDAGLMQAGPALLPWSTAGGGRGFLLLLPPRHGRARVLGPDGRVHRLPARVLRDALCAPHEAVHAPEVDALLAPLDLPARRRERTRARLLADRLADTRLAPWWQLRLPPSAPLGRQARQAGLPQRLLAMLALFALLYAGEIVGWGLVGDGVLQGRLDDGWLAAWVLVLATMLPLRWAGAALNAGFAQRAAGLLKARLLVGALHMDVDEVRRDGVGRQLGRVIESSALESLAVGGGLAAIVALLELGAAAVVLGLGAAPGPHLALLAAWTAVVAIASTSFGRRLADWTGTRLALTHELIEQMVGHRTRLAQERAARRDARDDAGLDDYLARSQALDHAALPLHTWLPALWMAAALALLVPAFMAPAAAADGGVAIAALAISVGGILLAQRAFGGLTGGLASLMRAGIAWREVAGLCRAGARAAEREPAVFHEPAPGGAAPGVLVDAQGLHFAHAGATPLLRGVDLQIGAGERVLLQGASGGGKSTLAALLTGARRPQSGLLLLQGLDAPTLGAQWNDLATAAPQFHENHVFSGTLAFNLLMGRQWPPTRETLAEAQALCEELGLGELIARMPAGLQQRVGETGWQLSHGERSRIFLARALLQRAPLTVLDESLAALDPQTLAQCLRTVQRHQGALVVIAHP